MTKPWFLARPIAHRGLHAGTKIPENSLAAFEAACQAGYPIELDCHYHVASGEIVVFHDDDLLRLVQDPRKLQEVTLPELLKQRLYESDQFICSLDQVLEVVAGRVPILIETKQLQSTGQFEQALIEKMDRYQGEWALQSFHHGALYWVQRHHPHVVKGMLTGSMEGVQIPAWQRVGVRQLALLPVIRPQFVACEADYLKRTNFQVPWRNLLGIPLIAWTIRSLKEYKSVRSHCDNVIFENFSAE